MDLNLSNPVCATTAGQDLTFAAPAVRSPARSPNSSPSPLPSPETSTPPFTAPPPLSRRFDRIFSL